MLAFAELANGLPHGNQLCLQLLEARLRLLAFKELDRKGAWGAVLRCYVEKPLERVARDHPGHDRQIIIERHG